MRYLITGGSGNLARQLARQLVADGDKVTAFDRVAPPAHYEGDYIHGDLTAPQAVAAALEQCEPDVLLHMASLLSGKCEQDRNTGWHVNVTATLGLFEAVLRSSVKTILFPSSLAAYGGELPDPLGEDHPQWPRGIYGVSKATCERLGNYYHHVHGMDFRCLRLPIVISRFAPPGAASAYASRVFVECAQSQRFTFNVNPDTACSTVYVLDVLEGIRRFVRAPRRRLTRCAYNIHSIAPSARQLADAATARFDADIAFDIDPAADRLINSWPRVVVDDSARRDWDWSPTYTLEKLADHFSTELRSEFADRPRIQRGAR